VIVATKFIRSSDADLPYPGTDTDMTSTSSVPEMYANLTLESGALSC
jgi:hypothetical protein